MFTIAILSLAAALSAGPVAVQERPISEIAATQIAAECLGWPQEITQATRKLESEPRATHEPFFHFPDSVSVMISAEGTCRVVSTGRYISMAPAFMLKPHSIAHRGELQEGSQVFVMFFDGDDGAGNRLFTGMAGKAGENLSLSKQ